MPGLKTLICFTVFLSTILVSVASQAAPAPLSHLGDGRPGCWNRIRMGALTDAEVKALPKECAQLRDDYFASIEAAKKDPAKYEKKLVQTLKGAKRSKAPYEAILFASLIQSDTLIEALKERAAVEKKLKTPFSYASAAVFRLVDKKECVSDPHFSNVFYREVCQGEDSILPTFFKLGGKK